MKKLNLILLSMVFATFTFGQNEEKNKEEFKEYQVQPFHSIYINGTNLTVILSQGDSQSVKTKILKDKDFYTVKVRDSVLRLGTKSPYAQLKIYVTVKELKGIIVKGVVTLKGDTKITSESIYFKIEGVAKVDMELYVNKLETNIQGVGHFNLEGKAREHILNVEGAGHLKAYDLETEKTVVNCSGASVVKVNVNDKLSGKVSGVSKIYYIGEANTDELEVSSMSVLKRTDGETDSEDEYHDIVDIDLDFDHDLSDMDIEEGDTVRFRVGPYKFWIFEEEDHDREGEDGHEHKNKKGRNEIWSGFEMGVNGYLNSTNGIEMPSDFEFLELDYGKSFNFNLNFYEKDFRIIHEYMKIVTGLGFEWSAYVFNNNTILYDNKDSLGEIVDTDILNYSKSKLKIFRINLPLLLEFNTNVNPKKAVHIAGGMIFGYNLGVRSKLVYKEKGDKRKDINKSRFYTNPFRYGVTARLGYGKHFRVFATYDLSELFQANVGPELHPFSVGLTLIGL